MIRHSHCAGNAGKIAANPNITFIETADGGHCSFIVNERRRRAFRGGDGSDFCSGSSGACGGVSVYTPTPVQSARWPRAEFYGPRPRCSLSTGRACLPTPSQTRQRFAHVLGDQTVAELNVCRQLDERTRRSPWLPSIARGSDIDRCGGSVQAVASEAGQPIAVS
jgi:hypothetical protein